MILKRKPREGRGICSKVSATIPRRTDCTLLGEAAHWGREVFGRNCEGQRHVGIGRYDQ